MARSKFYSVQSRPPDNDNRYDHDNDDDNAADDNANDDDDGDDDDAVGGHLSGGYRTGVDAFLCYGIFPTLTHAPFALLNASHRFPLLFLFLLFLLLLFLIIFIVGAAKPPTPTDRP